MNDKLVCETGIGFTKRDNNVKSEEDKGNLEFTIVRNDGTDDNLRMLTDLKNIIAKQLPKMPKEYIVRLVFDRKHESMVIRKKDGKVIGGVCYRPNVQQQFIEIAFLAISSLEQVKGYGTRLMNKLKDHCKTKGLLYFLTYADNNAIGYFKKQGFSTYVRMALEQWKDYIKDYDGGTLMEAYCNPNIDYSGLSEIIKKQKEIIKNTIVKHLNIKRINKYNEFEKVIKKFKNTEGDSVDIDQIFFDSIPGMRESGWNYELYKLSINNENNITFYTQCKNIIKKLKLNKNSWPFIKPVDKKEVPDYYDVIKDPMDITSLEGNLESGIYNEKEKFIKDIKKIFVNAKTYNKQNTIYYKYAKDLELSVEDDIKNLKDK